MRAVEWSAAPCYWTTIRRDMEVRKIFLEFYALCGTLNDVLQAPPILCIHVSMYGGTDPAFIFFSCRVLAREPRRRNVLNGPGRMPWYHTHCIHPQRFHRYVVCLMWASGGIGTMGCPSVVFEADVTARNNVAVVGECQVAHAGYTLHSVITIVCYVPSELALVSIQNCGIQYTTSIARRSIHSRGYSTRKRPSARVSSILSLEAQSYHELQCHSTGSSDALVEESFSYLELTILKRVMTEGTVTSRI